MTDKPLLTTRQVADYLCVPVSTIYRWRYVGTGPTAIKVGVHLRFAEQDLEAWLTEQKTARHGSSAAQRGG